MGQATCSGKVQSWKIIRYLKMYKHNKIESFRQYEKLMASGVQDAKLQL